MFLCTIDTAEKQTVPWLQVNCGRPEHFVYLLVQPLVGGQILLVSVPSRQCSWGIELGPQSRVCVCVCASSAPGRVVLGAYNVRVSVGCLSQGVLHQWLKQYCACANCVGGMW